MTDGAPTTSGYEVLGKLASGGMAEIFLARSVSPSGVSRYCVLKRILPALAEDPTFVRMFLDEARLAATLRHSNIAQVFDIGRLGSSYFFSMEYVHGETVRSLIRDARASGDHVPLHVVLTIAGGIAAGLHHAHTRVGEDGKPLGIVHRDVSPSNLMVSYEGAVKVVDFGVAKARTARHKTEAGQVKGKVRYLSPEQARGGDVIDRRSDLFSLGIVLWEMLTGERLYRRPNDFETMHAIILEPPLPPSRLRPDIPPDVDAIALQLLAKDPDKRYQSADAVAEAIERSACAANVLLSASRLESYMVQRFGAHVEPTIDTPRRAVSVTADSLSDAVTSVDEQDRRLASVPALPDLPEPAPSSRTHVRPRASLTRELHAVAASSRLVGRSPRVCAALPSESAAVRPVAHRRAISPRAWVFAIAAAAGALAVAAIWGLISLSHERARSPSMDPPRSAVERSLPLATRATPDPAVAERSALRACREDLRDPSACTLLACRLRDAPTARTFFRKVDRRARRPLVTTCRAFDVELGRRTRGDVSGDS
ncbi:MAG TPA: serine/threonine-protein kinase [Kofleriaceae bacterium]|nr:serine/threonine-protein kinase [Kofleriaceae bacterium]